MRLSALVPSAAAVIALSLAGSFAAADTVTSVDGLSYTATWNKLGTSTGSVSITTDQPRSGDGSLRLETNAGNKAAATFGGNRFGGPNLGTFGQLLDGGSLGFEFLRDLPSTSSAHFAPALEITFNNGAALKWEAVYNGYPIAAPVAEGQWYSIDLNATTGKFWQYNGTTVLKNGAQANLTLAEWLSAGVGNAFSASTLITGISIQAGGGFNNQFIGYVDNVYLNAGPTQLAANFETQAVPTPAAASAGLALLGALAAKRTRRQA